MQKTHKETETREIEVVDDIVCNKCGKSIRTVPENQCLSAPLSAMECVSVRKSWGFNSKKDMLVQDVDICEPCWDEFCATFAVPPSVSDYTGWTPDEPVQLSLFNEDEMNGYYSTACGFVPPTPGYAPCTRDIGHSGPCAHPLE